MSDYFPSSTWQPHKLPLVGSTNPEYSTRSMVIHSKVDEISYVHLPLHSVYMKRYVYVHVIYTPNLASGITVSVWEREQGCLRGSLEGARGAPRGAEGNTTGQFRGCNRWSLKWLHRYRLELLLVAVQHIQLRLLPNRTFGDPIAYGIV